jgi:predicted CXXCH cytochrome family protein
MKGWKLCGLLAAIVIVVAIPIYARYQGRQVATSAVESDRAQFVGREKCKECHKPEYDSWLGSDHDMAMDVATDETVLGDFDNALFVKDGVESRFFKKEGQFFVNTEGPDGTLQDFQITHTFGVKPLQQYLIPFPGGRYQCLPIAWDTEGKRWYHLNQGELYRHDDWLHWTNQSANWNGMCADCHSTNLKKNYDPETKTYATTFFEIDVSCEACHGPGSEHVAWGELPAMARPGLEDLALVTPTSNITSQQQVELCARCHSRRTQFRDFEHGQGEFLDAMMPLTLDAGRYFPDGQILDEVYVYGSFTQSKMYENGVRCSDCHDVHSGKVRAQDNSLCLSCHKEAIYATRDHHFHKSAGEEGQPVVDAAGNIVSAVGEGAECVRCHMPGRIYMGVDFRRDHSLRRPRPDLTAELDTPNVCNQCHQDKSVAWAEERMTKWYGSKKRPHYATTIEQGRNGLAAAEPELIKLAADVLYPVIVRATALNLLSTYRSAARDAAFSNALRDTEAFVRYTAVRHFKPADPGQRVRMIAPMLYDEVMAVRMEAAMNLTELPAEALDAEYAVAFASALDEYRGAMEYVGDFSYAGHNLGNLYANLGEVERAQQAYLDAIAADSGAYRSKVNLAMLYNSSGDKKAAAALLVQVADQYPELAQVNYSLGLLLAEMKRYDPALEYLEKAAKGMPQVARIRYNLGLLYQTVGRAAEAESAFWKVLEIDPANLDTLYTLMEFYAERQQYAQALTLGLKIEEFYPQQPQIDEILNWLRQQLN